MAVTAALLAVGVAEADAFGVLLGVGVAWGVVVGTAVDSVAPTAGV